MEIGDSDADGAGGPGKGIVAVLLLIGILVPVLMAAYLVFDLTPPGTAPGGTTTSGGGPLVVIPSGVGANQALNYEPVSLTVVVGLNNTVTWSERDQIPHTVTSAAIPTGAAAFDSEIMNKGDAFTWTFTTPGTYEYFCTLHPGWMRGHVVVVSAGTGS